MHLFSSLNILLARSQFWGFDRLMIFYIGKNLQQLTSIQTENINKEPKNTTDIQVFDVASWAL